MELLSYPKTDYLLNVSLESLHHESKEWLKEIDFWRDELAFFAKLLIKGKSSDKADSEKMAASESELLHLSSDALVKLRNDIQNHERALATMFKSNAPQEASYRDMHRKLLLQMTDHHILIRNLKKDIFSIIEND